MKKSVLITALLLGLSAQAMAGDPAAGEAKSLVCGACHGADGNSLVPSFPKLAGQNERYLLKQLMDIKSGARVVPTMAGQLTAMSEEDMANLAAFYASKTNSGGKTAAEKAGLGEDVYRGGIASRGVAACTACHSPTGTGNAPAGFPALAGQHADYIASQLRAFRKGAQDDSGRTNDGDTRIMRDIAFGMSDKEIDAVASYIAGLQ
ncbi:MAG: cytochrome c553 [Halieaceae bacterium]|jgi:cytochrome c553